MTVTWCRPVIVLSRGTTSLGFPALQGAIHGVLARPGEGQRGRCSQQKQGELNSGGHEKAALDVDHQNRAEHLECEENTERSGEQPKHEGNPTKELEQCHSRTRNAGEWNTHLPEGA